MKKFVFVLTLLSLAGALLALAQGPALTGENAADLQFLGVARQADPLTTGLFYLPDGRLLLGQRASGGHKIIIFDPSSQAESVLWEGDSVPEGLALSGDAAWLAFITGDGREVLLLKTDGTRPARSLYQAAARPEAALSLALNAEGTQLAVGRGDGSLVLLNAGDGSSLASLNATPQASREDLTALVFLPDGKLLAGHQSGWLRLWDSAGPAPLLEWGGHKKAITDIALSPNGDQLATAGADHWARVWSLEGALVYEWAAYASELAFSPDGSLLAAGDKSLFVWSLSDGALLFQDYHANGGVSANFVSFSPDASLIASGGQFTSLWGISSDLALATVEDDPLATGARLYERNACYGCHATYDSGAPSLFYMAERAPTRREGMGAEEYVYEAIVDPDVWVVPGYPRAIHPGDYGRIMSPEEIEMLVAYVLSLRPR